MLDPFQVQEDLIGVRVGAPAVLRAAVSQDAKDIYPILVVKGQDLIVQEVGSGKGLVRVNFCEADVGGCRYPSLIELSNAFYIADVAGVLGKKEAGMGALYPTMYLCVFLCGLKGLYLCLG